jgi:hypothetical protein
MGKISEFPRGRNINYYCWLGAWLLGVIGLVDVMKSPILQWGNRRFELCYLSKSSR